MKILQLGKFHPIRGGVEKVMLDLTAGLSAAGLRCDMLCAAEKGSYTVRLNPLADIFAVRSLAKVKATMLSPAMIWRLRKTAHRYDIIHIHHPDPMAALALRLSGFRGRVVLHWHSDIVRQRQLLRLVRPLQAWLLRRADIIVGTSPVYLAESPWLRDYQNKCRCVPIGIPPVEKPSDEAIDALREQYGRRRIIFAMGRLVGYKGFEYLIDAARFLPDDFVVVIGGCGPLECNLRKRITEHRFESKVTLAGYISDQQLPTYYHAATLFCLPSIERTEAFGVVQIEAMSCGTPVVATRIPGSGVSWVNADGVSGLNVDPADPEKLADAIVRTASDQSFGAGALQRYCELFTRDQMISDITLIYNQLKST